MDVTRYRWNGTQLVDNSSAHPVPLYVADSFLVSEGTAVGFDLHIERFKKSAIAQGLVRPIDDFLYAATEVIPRKGNYFPRIDLTQRGELEIHLRPSPELTQSLTVVTAAHDPREEPLIKGPDIPALALLREQARHSGSDEAIIVNSQGHIVDGTTTCLVWLDGQTLFRVSPEIDRVESVTEKVMCDIARDKGLTVESARVRPQDLDGMTLWAINSLHGIRHVTQWHNGPELAPIDDRLKSWRESYSELFKPLSGEMR